MTGVGMYATVLVDSGCVHVFVGVDRDGDLSEPERAARDIILSGNESTTPEMDATRIEQLAKLIPLRCPHGAAIDVDALVASIRKGTVLQ